MNATRSPQHWASLVCLGLCLSLFQPRSIPVAQAQERSAEENYRYEPSGKRDPFFSPLHRVTETAPVPDEAKTPLQRLDLGQFKLVGVILDTSEPKALIEDNSGLGYIVTRGTLIGAKGGVIRAIESRRVVVEEYDVDFYGKRQLHERELNLTVADASIEGETNSAK
jgi:type IV pilus assembly protein PilP